MSQNPILHASRVTFKKQTQTHRKYVTAGRQDSLLHVALGSVLVSNAAMEEMNQLLAVYTSMLGVVFSLGARANRQLWFSEDHVALISKRASKGIARQE